MSRWAFKAVGLLRCPIAPIWSALAFMLMLTASCAESSSLPQKELDVLGRGGNCSKQLDCFVCEDCRSKYGEVCVSNQCWLSGEQNLEDPESYPLVGSHSILIEFPRGFDASGIKSGAIRYFHHMGVDGRELQCVDLLADVAGVDSNKNLNLLQAIEPPFHLSTGDDILVAGASNIPAGEGRLVLIRLHSLRNGEGSVLGMGCSEEIDVESGIDTRIIVEISTVLNN